MHPRSSGQLPLACALFLFAGQINCDGDDSPQGCADGLALCGEECVSLFVSVAHCGACDNACSPGLACFEGECVLSCPGGLLDCGGSCVRLDSKEHCGACGNACEGNLSCLDGQCRLDCINLQECLGECRDVLNDPMNCGGCGSVCRRDLVCREGACVVSCPSGQVICPDEDPETDDCTDLRNNRMHCGSCDGACASLEICRRGQCVCADGLERCMPGRPCIDLSSDPLNCGACGNRCGGDRVCMSSSCVLECDTGFTDCGGRCVDLRSSPFHCGSCGNACFGPPATVPVCANDEMTGAPTCGAVCVADFGDCDGDLTETATASNGCETKLRESFSHCGQCGRSCDLANGRGECQGGRCRVVRCDPNFEDRNGDASDGCEIGIGEDCREPIELRPGTSSYPYGARSLDILTGMNEPRCLSPTFFRATAPDLVFTYTSTVNGWAEFSVLPTTEEFRRFAVVTSSRACGTIDELSCIAGPRQDRLHVTEFPVSNGQTAYIYLTDTDSAGSLPGSPIPSRLRVFSCDDAPQMVSSTPASGSPLSSLRPTLRFEFDRPLSARVGRITITGTVAFSQVFDLSSTPPEVDFEDGERIIEVELTGRLAPFEGLTARLSGLEDAFCQRPVPEVVVRTSGFVPPCFPGVTPGMVGSTVTRIPTRTNLVTNQRFVFADPWQPGFAYFGGATELWRHEKGAGSAENLIVLAGLQRLSFASGVAFAGSDVFALSTLNGPSNRVVRISSDRGSTFIRGGEDWATYTQQGQAPRGGFRGVVYESSGAQQVFTITYQTVSGQPTEIWGVGATGQPRPLQARRVLSFGPRARPDRDLYKCSGLSLDDLYFYTVCLAPDPLDPGRVDVRAVRIDRSTGGVDVIVDGLSDFSQLQSAIVAHDVRVNGRGDGRADFLYLQGGGEETFFVCQPAAAGPWFFESHASWRPTRPYINGSYGLSFDGRSLWSFDGSTGELIRID